VVLPLHNTCAEQSAYLTALHCLLCLDPRGSCTDVCPGHDFSLLAIMLVPIGYSDTVLWCWHAAVGANTAPSRCFQVGGVGLNLTGADVVIFLEHDWNPTRDLQVCVTGADGGVVQCGTVQCNTAVCKTVIFRCHTCMHTRVCIVFRCTTLLLDCYELRPGMVYCCG
jgi:hypothetical protein